eukprot:13915406-Ditylum_brightwellii.AAC.1
MEDNTSKLQYSDDEARLLEKVISEVEMASSGTDNDKEDGLDYGDKDGRKESPMIFTMIQMQVLHWNYFES